MNKLSKTTTKFTKIIILLKLAIISAGVIFVILHFIDNNQWYKILSYFATIAVVFVPEGLSFFGLKISPQLHLAYLLFLVPSMIFGIDLDLYRLWDGYDKAIHLLSGVFATFVMLEVINNCKIKDRRFAFLALISFVALTAVGWECFEFFYDQIFGGSMQQLIRSGVEDTMWDLTAAMSGGLLTCFSWLIYSSKNGSK